MTETWDRSKQNYWISRRGDPWTIHASKENDRYVCDYPAYHYDTKLIDQICFAKNDEEVKQLVESIKEKK
jgi:hypothetical protein